MTTPFEKLEQLFYDRTELSKKDLLSLFDAAGIPTGICWRTVYKIIFDTKLYKNLNQNLKITGSQLEPIMKQALKNVREGVYTEKSLLSLIKNLNVVSLSVYDTQLNGLLNELNFLTSEFKSISNESQEKVKILESETVTVVESNSPLEDKIKLIKLKFKETISAFKKDLVRLDQMSHRDHLTGLYNRRFFDEQLEKEISRSLKEKYWVNVLLIDIDDFKLFNDRFGHPIGDQALKTIAKHIRDVCKEHSNKTGIDFFPTRYGGEEFAVILPYIHKQEALDIAQLIRTKISSYVFVIRSFEGKIKHKNLKQTVSIGVGTLNHRYNLKEGIKKIVREADQMMYEAKKSGKNCIKTSTESIQYFTN